MDAIQRLIAALSRFFQCLYVVQPWEQGVRVRAGKGVVLHGPGVHFIIPFVDQVYVQNTRLRMMHTSTQTLSTADGRPLTLAGSIRYRIDDVLKLYLTLHQAESTVKQELQARIAEFVITHSLTECRAQAIQDAVNSSMDLGRYGLAEVEFYLTDCVHVRTYRLISDSMQQYSYGGSLDTCTAKTPSQAGVPVG